MPLPSVFEVIKKFFPIILTTGGKIKDNQKEAVLQKNLLIKHKIPESAIYIEENSMNTKENSIYSRLLIEKENLKHNRIMIICKSYHARRVYMTFKNDFRKSEIIIIPADIENINKKDWYKNLESKRVVMGEVYKIGEYTLKGDLIIN